MNTKMLNHVIAHSWAITTTVLYSTGHWIGGTVALVFTIIFGI